MKTTPGKRAIPTVTAPQHSGGERQNHWITVNGLNIFYTTAGKSGDYVLFIHGGGSDHSGLVWRHAIPAIAAGFRVISVDLPGFGNSDKPLFLRQSEDPATTSGTDFLAYMSDFIYLFLNELGIEIVNITGFSMGGGVALGFALKHPRRVKKLVLVNSYGLEKPVFGGAMTYVVTRSNALWQAIRWAIRSSRPLVKWGLKWSVHRPNDLTDELVDDVFAAIRKQKQHPAWRTFQQQEITLLGYKTTFVERLNELQIPVLFIQSEKDLLIPHRLVKPVLKQLSNAHIYIVKNAGHLLPRENPAVFNRVLMDFLSDNFNAGQADEIIEPDSKDNSAVALTPDKLP